MKTLLFLIAIFVFVQAQESKAPEDSSLQKEWQDKKIKDPPKGSITDRDISGLFAKNDSLEAAKNGTEFKPPNLKTKRDTANQAVKDLSELWKSPTLMTVLTFIQGGRKSSSRTSFNALCVSENFKPNALNAFTAYWDDSWSMLPYMGESMELKTVVSEKYYVRFHRKMEEDGSEWFDIYYVIWIGAKNSNVYFSTWAKTSYKLSDNLGWVPFEADFFGVDAPSRLLNPPPYTTNLNIDVITQKSPEAEKKSMVEKFIK